MAKLTEQSITDKHNRESLRNTSNQLALLQSTVQEMRRLSGQIRTFDIEITAQQIATNVEFSSLQTYLAGLKAAYEDSWPPPLNNEETEGGPHVHLRAISQGFDLGAQPSNFSDVNPGIPERYLEWWDGADGKPQIHFKLISEGQTTPLAKDWHLKIMYGQLQRIASKAFQVRFCYEHEARLGGASFKVDPAEEKAKGRAYMWRFDTNGKVVGFFVYQEIFAAFCPVVRNAELVYETTTKKTYLK